MPTYEYECLSCCQRFELKQSFDDKPIDICPQCGGAVRRLLSPVPVIFKGSGFYVTDNRKVSPTESLPDIKSPATEKPKEAKKQS
jgi:putative FmdB family regulatory protein